MRAVDLVYCRDNNEPLVIIDRASCTFIVDPVNAIMTRIEMGSGADLFCSGGRQ
jgi:hypothetical protein